MQGKRTDSPGPQGRGRPLQQLAVVAEAAAVGMEPGLGLVTVVAGSFPQIYFTLQLGAESTCSQLPCPHGQWQSPTPTA